MTEYLDHPPQRVHHCLVYFLIRHPFSKVKLQNKRQMRFFKKELKKGKTFHNEEKQQKKVFHVAVLSLFFFMFKTPCQCATLIFLFSFFMAVNKLLFSIWWFFSCRCCSVQVKHRMFSLSFFFLMSCF